MSPTLENLPAFPKILPIPPEFPKIPFAPPNIDPALLPIRPPKDVPGIPKPIAPAIAALPNGLLTTFLTPRTAFFTKLPKP